MGPAAAVDCTKKGTSGCCSCPAARYTGLYLLYSTFDVVQWHLQPHLDGVTTDTSDQKQVWLGSIQLLHLQKHITLTWATRWPSGVLPADLSSAASITCATNAVSSYTALQSTSKSVLMASLHPAFTMMPCNTQLHYPTCHVLHTRRNKNYGLTPAMLQSLGLNTQI